MEYKFSQVKSLDDLKKKIHDGAHDFFIRLNVGMRSSKYIDHSFVDNKFYVMNEIDGSEQLLTDDEIMDDDYTNIGKAIRNGALWSY